MVSVVLLTILAPVCLPLGNGVVGAENISHRMRQK